MRLGSGYEIIRKEKASGEKFDWKPEENACLRTQLQPFSYIDSEDVAAGDFYTLIGGINNESE